MNIIGKLFNACSTVQKSAIQFREEDASDAQLHAFEFRNYTTDLEPAQQRMLERIVNTWCAMLVRGKTIRVDAFDEKVYLDKDLVNIQTSGGFYRLKDIIRIEMFKDTDDLSMDAPWGVTVTFQNTRQEANLHFNFSQERHRLNFILTLRILRSRDPTLDKTKRVEVIKLDDEEDEEDEEDKEFGKLVGLYRYNVEAGLPIVLSVSKVNLIQKVRTNSRNVFMEFFVRYPNYGRFLYAKSNVVHMPPAAVMEADDSFRVKKGKKTDDADEQDTKERRGEAASTLVVIKFDLNNVKLKIPKAPYVIFGRLMAKDDYFPTAVGTFEFEVKKNHILDRRSSADPKDTAKKAAQRQTEVITVPIIGTWKTGPQESGENPKIGIMLMRIQGFLTDPPEHRGRRNDETEDYDENDEEEDEFDDDEEAEKEAEGQMKTGTGMGSSGSKSASNDTKSSSDSEDEERRPRTQSKDGPHRKSADDQSSQSSSATEDDHD